MDKIEKRIILLLITILVVYVAISSLFLQAKPVESNDIYVYNSDWVTEFVGRNPITSVEQAKETYLMLIDKAPRKSYWIIYAPEDNGLPLKLEALETDRYYVVNGTFRNCAVNCPNAILEIVYNIYKSGTAMLESVQTKCPPIHEYQEYP